MGLGWQRRHGCGQGAAQAGEANGDAEPLAVGQGDVGGKKGGKELPCDVVI